MAVLDKQDLVKYLIRSHFDKYQANISPIKLQKALYFLFAFYAGKVSMLNLGNPFADVNAEAKDVELFEAKFEAWVYGPVDSSVYSNFKYDEIDTSSFDTEEFEKSIDDFTRGFLIDTTARIFNTSDFSLVDLSHDDDSWKSKFDRINIRSSKPILNEDIIREYTEKEFN